MSKTVVRDFAEIITDIRGGTAHHELSKQLRAVTEAVQKTGRVGALTLELAIRPQGSGQVEIVDKIKTKIPEHATPTTFMFVDEDGNLVRENPRQPNLFELQTLDTRTGELKEVHNG